VPALRRALRGAAPDRLFGCGWRTAAGPCMCAVPSSGHSLINAFSLYNKQTEVQERGNGWSLRAPQCPAAGPLEPSGHAHVRRLLTPPLSNSSLPAVSRAVRPADGGSGAPEQAGRPRRAAAPAGGAARRRAADAAAAAAGRAAPARRGRERRRPAGRQRRLGRARGLARQHSVRRVRLLVRCVHPTSPTRSLQGPSAAAEAAAGAPALGGGRMPGCARRLARQWHG